MSSTMKTNDDRSALLPRAVGRVVDALTLVSIGALTFFGLWASPADVVQGDAQRIMYLHVPAAWAAYVAFGITTLAPLLWLWPHSFCSLGSRRWSLCGDRAYFYWSYASAWLALGSPSLGSLVGMGRSPRLHCGSLLSLPWLPRN